MALKALTSRAPGKKRCETRPEPSERASSAIAFRSRATGIQHDLARHQGAVIPSDLRRRPVGHGQQDDVTVVRRFRGRADAGVIAQFVCQQLGCRNSTKAD
ncbi:hypothetical protein CXK91_02720 [Stutzerimonas stutzeri]|uniref:Uncharacterized protein n=1 Tax=Stutzerimonas stutzeri TaxID=316 RepID=A0A2S4ATY6_STUST|nr:hypothetical protein CXK91_02720 [Stutzerimonas stutzeri]